MSRFEQAKQTRDATAESIAQAIRGTVSPQPSPPPVSTTPASTPPVVVVAKRPPAPSPAATPPKVDEEGLIRIGITMPHALYDRVGDAQYVLQKARRRVSVSALFEVAMNELLAREPSEILAAVQRYGASPRRDGRRK